MKGDNNIPFILVTADLLSLINTGVSILLPEMKLTTNIFQVGNKADLVGSRQVQQGTANGKAAEWNVRFSFLFSGFETFMPSFIFFPIV